MFVSINTAKNRPEIHKKKRVAWDRPQGTRVEAQIEGGCHKGDHSIATDLRQTALANAHVTIHFREPHGDSTNIERSSSDLPLVRSTSSRIRSALNSDSSFKC
jgi:DNA topoisomerase-6 subunit B